MKIILKNVMHYICVLMFSALYISNTYTSEDGDAFDLLEKTTIEASNFLAEAQRISQSQKKLSQESKQELNAAKMVFFEINEILNHISSNTIVNALKKQKFIIELLFKLNRQVADASLGITFIQEDIQKMNGQSTPQEFIDPIIALKDKAKEELFQIQDTIDDVRIATIKTVDLILRKLPSQHLALDKNVLTSLRYAQEIFLILIEQNMIDSARRAADLIVQLAELLSGKPEGVNPAKKAKELANKIKKMLPPSPPETNASAPALQATAPQVDAITNAQTVTPIPATVTSGAEPVQAPVAMRTPIAPGKGLENINKINSKLSSALRRLDNIKKYYHELDKEERAIIRKKAENIAHDYESSFTGLVQRIQQVKQSDGNLLDPAKMTPFNTFIDLFNKLVSSIKSL